MTKCTICGNDRAWHLYPYPTRGERRAVEFIPASWILEKREAFNTAYKIVAQKLHPDKEGGDEEAFKKLQTAADVLKRHHGVSE